MSSSSSPSSSSSSSASPPIAIVGAGYLGAAVAAAWSGPVLAVTRSGRWREGPVPPHVEVLGLDIGDDALDPGPLRTASALVLCVAPGRTQDRRALYVDGTRRLLHRIGAGRLERLVWVGSTSALPDRDAWLDERCSIEPSTERGIVQRQAEHVIVEHAQQHGIPWLVLRLGGLYGPGRGVGRIYRRRHDGPLPGDGMAPTNLIHRDDAVAAVRAALQAPPTQQGVVHVVDDDHTPRRSMYAKIAALEGRAPVPWADPVPPGTAPHGKRVSNRRLKHWLGVRLQVPLHRLEPEPEPLP
ncbi:MAG: NAD-dependent epimerase/dehydratase family protein [Myxococcota bacterium]